MPASPLAGVRQLITAGKRDQALAVLERLRRASPRDAHVPYLMGRLYFQKHWWLDGMRQYLVAIKINDRYRRDPRLNRDIIAALADGKTAPKATWIILKYLGRNALPYLERAARESPSRDVRRRAGWLAKRVK